MTHTWEIVIHYHRCPHCGAIVESRKGYRYRLGQYQKRITCDRCGQKTTLTREGTPTFGPLIGDPQPPEIEWGC